MIPTADVREASTIVLLATDALMATSKQQIGRAGSDLRRACGDMRAHVEEYIVHNEIAPKLAYCFSQASVTGATVDDFDSIRATLVGQTVVSVVAALFKNSCIRFCLQQMSMALLKVTFTSREDVDTVRQQFTDAFSQAEEVAADDMAQATYQTLVSLHARVMFYLYQTARPLPQMLDFQFAAIRPTLIQSYRLYADASRADQIREENKVVHPAFAPRVGRALSF